MGDVKMISHSQLSSWQRCPRQWEYRYVEKIKKPIGTNLILGTLYHDALQAYFARKVENGEELNISILEGIYDDDWTKKLKYEKDRMGIKWGDEKPINVKQLGITLVRLYVKEMAWQVEPVHVELPLNSMIGDVKVTFRLDLIDVNGNVIDHKTSSKAYNQGDVDKDLQASAYASALNKEIRFMNHVAIKTKIPKIQTITTYRSRQDITWWTDMATGIIAHMNTGICPPNPNGWHCSPDYCDYWEECRSSLGRIIMDMNAQKSNT